MSTNPPTGYVPCTAHSPRPRPRPLPTERLLHLDLAGPPQTDWRRVLHAAATRQAARARRLEAPPALEAGAGQAGTTCTGLSCCVSFCAWPPGGGEPGGTGTWTGVHLHLTPGHLYSTPPLRLATSSCTVRGWVRGPAPSSLSRAEAEPRAYSRRVPAPEYEPEGEGEGPFTRYASPTLMAGEGWLSNISYSFLPRWLSAGLKKVMLTLQAPEGMTVRLLVPGGRCTCRSR